MASIVSMKGVAKAYQRGKQRVEVLRGIDLEVERGEFLALMGPSGSGKTTLLNLIGGLDRPDRGELSGGQQQRVAIARALVSDPSVLVCDEPTGDLDRETSDAILGLLQLLNRSHGKTIVMVTHDPRAADHASRRLYVDKGVLGLAPLGAAA